jgi:hypothetical protein
MELELHVACFEYLKMRFGSFKKFRTICFDVNNYETY